MESGEPPRNARATTDEDPGTEGGVSQSHEPRSTGEAEEAPTHESYSAPEAPPNWFATYGAPLWRALVLVLLLVALLVLRKPCSDGVAAFVTSFGETNTSSVRQGDAGTRTLQEPPSKSQPKPAARPASQPNPYPRQ